MPWAARRKIPTLHETLYSQCLKNKPIVLCKIASEYCQYLFAPWHCSRTKFATNSAAVYVRHRPETPLLYQVIEEYWPDFQTEVTSQGKHLPTFICREFYEYL